MWQNSKGGDHQKTFQRATAMSFISPVQHRTQPHCNATRLLVLLLACID